MPMQRDVYPLVINLPDGRRAEYVPGSRPARYTIDGELSDLDVTIPDDLVATGWYWSGSFLYQPWPERKDGPGLAISTALYGPPSYADERGTCFDAARRMEARRAEPLVLCVSKPPKHTKSQKSKAERPTKQQSEQLEMAF